MRILLFGKNGQLGRELNQLLASRGEVLALGREGMGEYCGDFLSEKDLVATIEKFRPDIVFNAAAYTNVELAEQNQRLAFQVNANSVGQIAHCCARLGATLVHYSTDYVFDGSKEAEYLETDLPNPLNVYGLSKLEGEKAVMESNCSHLVIRTSWVYSTYGCNFVNKIIDLAQKTRYLSVVGDQIGTPTSATFLAEYSVLLAVNLLKNRSSLSGIYNVVPDGSLSRYDFAKWILQHVQHKKCLLSMDDRICKISSSNLKTAVIRPMNSRLSNEKLKRVLNPHYIKSWDYYAKQIIDML